MLFSVWKERDGSGCCHRTRLLMTEKCVSPCYCPGLSNFTQVESAAPVVAAIAPTDTAARCLWALLAGYSSSRLISHQGTSKCSSRLLNGPRQAKWKVRHRNQSDANNGATQYDVGRDRLRRIVHQRE
ncbi:hypothetical protein CSUI_002623 [Cystoisospora suis]|uniref:Uncharacterized protein n=1 Tax=Cystoisospora suis TaxID=483139 RepID=A0A2C6L862_9APIC|nr:hypothetical protein CSUI_002623 [Cystoisospora suis]